MYIITLQTVASLQNLVNKHTLEVPPVFHGLNGKGLLDYRKLFSPSNFPKFNFFEILCI